jgi:predicted ATPase/SAM-dependent methyltransferase
MKITEVDIPESDTSSVGLKHISMKKIGDIVLLAGKNGSGKTRILNLIRTKTALRHQIIENSENASKQIDKLSKKNQELVQYIRNVDNEIQTRFKYIDKLKKEIEQNPPHIDRQERIIKEKKEEIESFESQKKNFAQEIEQIKHQIQQENIFLNVHLPINPSSDKQPIETVNFVPNKTELEDWTTQTEKQWKQQATQANALGVQKLHQATIPLIQQVASRWFNATHPKFTTEDIQKAQKAINDFERLQDIVKSFLNSELNFDLDGHSTIFGKPIAKSELSAGQTILLQLCVAIFTQGASLSNYIIFMDEPENHLHPSAVIDFIDAVRRHNPTGQIWIATHSIPLLSHFDASSLWFVEDGIVKHSGKKPELVLNSLLGGEEGIQKLRDFTSLPSELAQNRFAFECLFSPQVVETDSSDPQSIQLNNLLKNIWESTESINLLDFGAGKGRMIANLADYDNVSSGTLDYYAFDPSSSDKNCCLKNILLSYSDAEDRYHNSIESLRTKVGDNFFDVIVLSNVLHEIPYTSWCEVFTDIQILLKDDGHLLLIEDCLIPTGELPHKNGFLIFSRLHLQKLLNIPPTETKFKSHDARFNSEAQRDRLMAHLIPSIYLGNISPETIKIALQELKRTATSKIRAIRADGPETYSNGLAHSFWIQQMANATLCLIELGEPQET